MKSRLLARVVPGLLLAGGLLVPGVSAQAADVTGYGVLKGQQFFQVLTTTVPQQLSFRAFALLPPAGSIVDATVERPGGAGSDTLSAQDDPKFYYFESQEYSTQSELDADYPDGSYQMTIMTVHDGDKTATLTLSGPNPVNTPLFSNPPMTPISPSVAFTAQWSPLAGGTANDFVRLQVEDLMSSQVVFTTPPYRSAGALDGTSTSATMPANTLKPNYTLYAMRVMLVKVDSLNTTDYPGAIGVAGHFKETQVMLQTGAGTVDTTPPTLVSSSPTNNATGVPINAKIRFTFNEAMQASQAIAWSGNVTQASFTYSWSADAQTLTCTYATNLLANAPITWKLNPSGSAALFKDAAGNALPSDVFAGGFTTGTTTTNDLCNPEPVDESRGSASLMKSVQYLQTGSDAPVEQASDPALFAVILLSPTNNPVTAASLRLPNGTSLTLSNFFGRTWYLPEEYASQALLDGARPNGGYVLTVGRQTGGQQSLTLDVPADWPPIPQILDLAALQAIDPGADFVAQWNGFTAATDNDGIFFGINRGDLVFYAPDPCVPRPLPNTATAITVPKGTLTAGQTYNGDLRFTRVASFDTNSITDISGIVMLSKEVHFSLKTTGGTPPAGPKFTSVTVLANHHLELQLTGEAGRSYTIETATDLPNWTQPQTVVAPASGIVVFDAGPSDTAQRAFFRATAD